jgi:hypothetical protein
MKAKKHKARTKRIYHGPPGAETSLWWNVKVTDAKVPVTINGDVMHALRSFPGVTVGCGLSNMAQDNARAFPHPVYLASFTKSGCLIVDKLSKSRGGYPVHAIRYRHSYGHITEANDSGTLKKMAKDDPSIIEKPFTLHPPRGFTKSGKTAGQTPTHQRGLTDRAKAFVPRGALRRAVRAGRLHASVAQQLTDVAKERAEA